MQEPKILNIKSGDVLCLEMQDDSLDCNDLNNYMQYLSKLLPPSVGIMVIPPSIEITRYSRLDAERFERELSQYSR